MKWHITDAQSLRAIDQEIGQHSFSSAEYEVIRRVIYATADFEYQNLLRVTPQALQTGAAALAARSTIIVDVPMVQVGIMPTIQETFANPVYCSMEAITRPQREKTQVAWGIETLAHRYPEGIFVVGQAQTALTTVIDLVESGDIKPALIVATPTSFIEFEETNQRLTALSTPTIHVQSRKGGANVATSIMNALADLAWHAYGQKQSTIVG
jgi:precorrin-8X/cobalt-precorrin-8 methylmutase